MRKRVVGPAVMLALAMLLAGGPSHAGHPKCGGVAPVTTSCSVEFANAEFTPLRFITHYATFNGTISLTVTTSTGFTSFACTSSATPPYAYSCPTTGSGGFLSGPGTLSGTASGVGLWLVDMRSSGTCDEDDEFLLHCLTPPPL